MAGVTTLPVASETGTRAGAMARRSTGYMLKLALLFFVISLVAGFFGFSGVSAATAGIAKVLFFVALAVFAVLIVLALTVGATVL